MCESQGFIIRARHQRDPVSARGLIANMSDVLFKTGSFELLSGARERLAKVSGIVIAHPGLHLEVEGHTDSTGSAAHNKKLSEERAQSVIQTLVSNGVAKDRARKDVEDWLSTMN